ncbi:MAG: hypothetical protein B6244_05785 [Candidatus Cloacimonetes bacterium 4572_55]|nr:MAG: hypothetical protein B6244_05785 [Candidatus Cloacimonetes bacterium 4572_55]
MRNQTPRMNWNIVAGFLIGAGFLYISLRGIQLEKLWDSLERADYKILILASLVYTITFIFRTYRWGELLRPLTSARFSSLYHATTIAFMVNNILPLRIGEAVRAYLIGEWEEIDKAAAFATVIWERIFDSLALFPIILTLIFLPFPAPNWLRVAIAFIFSAYAVMIAMIVGLAFAKKSTKRKIHWIVSACLTIFRKLAGFIPNSGQESKKGDSIKSRVSSISDLILKQTDSFADMLLKVIDVIRNPLILIKISILSFLISIFIFLNIQMTIVAFFGIETHWTAGALMIVMIYMAVAIPSTPGYVGTFHGVCVLVLLKFDIDKSAGVGFAFLLHSMHYLINIALGMVSLLGRNLSLSRVTAQARKPQD